jgi:thiol:disulfide interchange protein
MTAIGFLLLVVAIWLAWATKEPNDAPSQLLSWFAVIGLVLIIAGITKFLWSAMP